MNITTDRNYYSLLNQLIEFRESNIDAFRARAYPIAVIRRTRHIGTFMDRSVSFRYRNNVMKSPTLKQLNAKGVPYIPGMLRDMHTIARVDLLIVNMCKQATFISKAATDLYMALIHECESVQVRPGKVLPVSAYEFSIDGPYTPLPYRARELALNAIHNAFVCASQKVIATNRLRRWNRDKSKSYSPRALPGILIRERIGVMPSAAEWGFFVRRWPEKHYRFQRTLWVRRHRGALSIPHAPTLFQIRSFKLKPYVSVFRNMGEFTRAVMKLRDRYRKLWQFIRTSPIKSRDIIKINMCGEKLCTQSA